jgi:hypothetical protein
MAALVFAGALTGSYYCLRTTGDPLLLPHQLNQDTYAISRPFIWQKSNPVPKYHHKMMQVLYERYLVTYDRIRTPLGFALQTLKKIARFWLFFIGPAFSFPLLVAFVAVRARRMRLLVWSNVAVLLAILVEVYFLPHYAAPVTAALYAVLLQSMRYIQSWRSRSKRVGLLIANAIPLICAGMLLVRILGQPLGLSFRTGWANTWYDTAPGMLARANLLRSLEHTGERHLILVRYHEQHVLDDEWVYNQADIDGAAVVWARDMGPSGNRELVTYFSNRRLWILEPDRTPLVLRPYQDAPQPKSDRVASR